MNELQTRVRAFIDRPVPGSINHVPGSIAEKLVASYAKTGQVDLSPDCAELLSICMLETEFAAKTRAGEEGEYFRESYQILSQILAEHST